jgi:hypothetical protein
MGRKRKTKRTYRLIGFKAFEDTDRDLLDWWEGIEEGERSEVMRDLLREILRLHPRTKGRRIELPQLAEIERNTEWIIHTLNDLPGWLEERLGRIAVLPGAVSTTPAPTARSPDKALNTLESERRTGRLKKATW